MVGRPVRQTYSEFDFISSQGSMNSATGLITDLIIEDQKSLPEVSGPLLLCGEKREEDWERRSRDDWTRDEPARDDCTRDEPARDDWTRDEPARDEGERVWEACCFDIQ